MRILILLLLPFIAISQSDVPEQYWISDDNFEDKITESQAFGDDQTKPVLVEFWAKFNEANAFADWNKLDGVEYYRVDIGKAPAAKKEYRVRMAPTLIIFKDGVAEESFKAGLDLECPVDLEELQEAIEEVKTAGAF